MKFFSSHLISSKLAETGTFLLLAFVVFFININYFVDIASGNEQVTNELFAQPVLAEENLLSNLPNDDQSGGSQAKEKQLETRDICEGLTDLACPFKLMLYGLAVLFGKLVSIGANLFITFTNRDVLQIFNMESIFVGWSFVRDIFNIVFIIALLFSAFATIFQISKYHLKQTLLFIVVMAFLVNFSWPIARFIIDMSNVLMLAFLPAGTGGTGFLADIANDTNFADILLQDDTGQAAGFVELFVIVLFTLIFALVFLAMGFQMLVRVAALAVLLVLAPVGFAGMAFPFTRGLADQWWQNFLKYAFVGPAMVIMLTLANLMISELAGGSTDFSNTFQNVSDIVAQNNSGGNTIGSDIVSFVIPIVFLVASMMVAGKMGVAGASMTTGMARKGFNRGARLAAGATGLTYAYRGVQRGVQKAPALAKTIGREGFTATGRFVDSRTGYRGSKIAGAAKGIGKRVSNMRERSKEDTQRERSLAESRVVEGRGNTRAGGRTPDAVKSQNEKMIAAKKDEYKKESLTLSTLAGIAKDDKSNDIEKSAARRQMAEKAGDVSSLEELKTVVSSMSGDASSLEKTFENVPNRIIKDISKSQGEAAATYGELLSAAQSNFDPHQKNASGEYLTDANGARVANTDLSRVQKAFDKSLRQAERVDVVWHGLGDFQKAIGPLQASQIADQKDMLATVQNNSPEHIILKNTINTPAVQQDLIKNASTSARQDIQRLDLDDHLNA